MNAPIKLAALFAGALLVLAQTSGAAEAGHGRKQVRTDDRQNQAVRIWDQDRSHKQGKAYGQRRYYGNDGDRHGKAYSQRRQYRNGAYRHGKMYGQRRYYSNDGYRHGKAYGRRTQRRYAGAGQWQHQGWQNQGWQHQAQRQRPRQNSDGRIANHRQRNQVWHGDQTYLDHSHGN